MTFTEFVGFLLLAVAGGVAVGAVLAFNIAASYHAKRGQALPEPMPRHAATNRSN